MVDPVATAAGVCVVGLAQVAVTMAAVEEEGVVEDRQLLLLPKNMAASAQRTAVFLRILKIHSVHRYYSTYGM